MLSLRSYAFVLTLLCILTLSTGCGKSNDSDAPASTTTTTSTSTTTASISGSVFAAPVSGASVLAKTASGTTLAGPVTTAADGTYTITIASADLASDLIIESSSGTYTDEATGSTTTAGKLAAYISGGTLSDGSSVHLDPSSTIVHDLVQTYGKSLSSAKSTFAAAFGYTPDTSIEPRNDAVSTASKRLAGLRAGVFSRLTQDLVLSAAQQFSLMASLAKDLSDGKLDGIRSAASTTELITVGSTTLGEDIQNLFEHSLATYLSDSTRNLTGLGPNQIGSLPFGRVALTPSYRIEYIENGGAAAVGKTSFRLKITDQNLGTAVTGTSVAVMPKMHMSFTDMHSTPGDTMAMEDGSTGIYDCTLYYVMGSGMNAGYWELKVTIGGMGGETATFYPSVGMMSMFGTPFMKLNTAATGTDLISGMMGMPAKRPWYVFFDELSSGMSPTISMFLAAKDTMMSFPSIVSGGTVTLHDQNNALIPIDTVEMKAYSSDWTEFTGSDDGAGYWSFSIPSGVISMGTNTVFVTLKVNGDLKSTSSSTYAAFTIKKM